MLRDLGESMLVSVRRWADPRERLLRKVRRARRRSIRYGTASGVTAVGAAGLVVAAAPAWIVVIASGGAAVLVLPAALAARKYLRLRDQALPPSSELRALPPMGSAAREPIVRLGKLERSLGDVLNVVARSAPVPPEELRETAETAQSAASALRALSVDIIDLERASKRVGGESPELHQSVMLAIGELKAGLREYQRLLDAAARMTPLTTGQRVDWDGPNHELRIAADRLDSWADALAELAAPAGAIGPGHSAQASQGNP
ncbi:hypothetical protein [Antrihabitans sp. YC2-6]|uniref:phage shock envelope stress response protein PspM n=1 Tax=Antrihabitans sp. YC2-6 TaxID=2799498 RepID=UPI0018F2D2EF|nr:hypothetical protein [Antrihabitans sp. YC2-6]MBJ8345003.1 hypothetical protein [Antrihabitans sp. YC2-6]